MLFNCTHFMLHLLAILLIISDDRFTSFTAWRTLFYLLIVASTIELDLFSLITYIVDTLDYKVQFRKIRTFSASVGTF